MWHSFAAVVHHRSVDVVARIVVITQHTVSVRQQRYIVLADTYIRTYTHTHARMRAVKICINKILQFLTGVLANACCKVEVNGV